jgi:hypothetical protein
LCRAREVLSGPSRRADARVGLRRKDVGAVRCVGIRRERGAL